MYRHRFDITGGRFPGALVSLLNPAEAFVDNPSHVGDPALQSNHLANHIAGLFVNEALYSFVVHEKADGVGGGLNIFGQIFIGSLKCDVDPALSSTDVLQYRPFSTGTVEDLVGGTGIYVSYTNTSYNVGDELFAISTHDIVSRFTANYGRPIYKPGVEI
jgi:hypothetical protein